MSVWEVLLLFQFKCVSVSQQSFLCRPFHHHMSISFLLNFFVPHFGCWCDKKTYLINIYLCSRIRCHVSLLSFASFSSYERSMCKVSWKLLNGIWLIAWEIEAQFLSSSFHCILQPRLFLLLMIYFDRFGFLISRGKRQFIQLGGLSIEYEIPWVGNLL